MKTKLFERLVTKFSIKVNDLAKYLEISKATIYNYRNLENFSDIPSDKQYKILYLFGKESVDDLELVLDESNNDLLAQYVNRISNILKDSVQNKKEAIVSLDNLSLSIDQLTKENISFRRQLEDLQKFSNIDEFTRTVLLNKVAQIVKGANTAEVRQFLEYLEIYEKYIELIHEEKFKQMGEK